MFAAFAAKQDENKPDETVVARKRLLRILRENPKVFLALRLPLGSDDRTIMKEMRKYDNPFELMRSAGMSIGDATIVKELVPLAMKAPPIKLKIKTKTSAELLVQIGAGVAFLVLLIMAAIIVYTILMSTAGWEVGKCSITMYTNQTCTQDTARCQFEVKVRGADTWVVMKSWGMPVEYHFKMGVGSQVVRFSGDALRCCNNAEGELRSCCDMQDRNAVFCDAWGSLYNDFNGKPCPSENWDCLYKMGEDPAFASEVEPYTPPDIMPFMICAIFSAISLVLMFLARILIAANINPCKPIINCYRWIGDRVVQEDEMYDEDPEEAAKPKGTSTKKVSQIARASQKSTNSSTVKDLKEAEANKNSDATAAKEDAAQKRRQSIASAASPHTGSSADSSEDSSSEDSVERIRRGRQTEDPEPLVDGSTDDLPGMVRSPKAQEDPEIEDVTEATYMKYVQWDSMDKDFRDLTPVDIHPYFQKGPLTRLQTQARNEIEDLLPPIIEPLARQTPLQLGMGRPVTRHGQRSRVVHPTDWGWTRQETGSFEGHQISDTGRAGRGRELRDSSPKSQSSHSQSQKQRQRSSRQRAEDFGGRRPTTSHEQKRHRSP
eukprot:TRINITY_DN37015_c0_g1_i1.p1 TRINITY_DN37015_c0_g1~~TRINITY_DN37015_c0_g1_i1.p1  ORF type:complete len:604 (-),score=90.65 TRINITY_DN37015_c0_g1_i1:57-1868(-)